MTETLHKLAGISYTDGMTNQATNVTPIRTNEQQLRIIRGAFVANELRSQRWSIRQAAGELNMSHTALGDRIKGKVSFLAEDIADIAHLLHRDPVAFYGDFLNAKKAPTPEGEGPTLPDLDSNQEPAVIPLAAYRRDKGPYLDRQSIAPVTRMRLVR